MSKAQIQRIDEDLRIATAIGVVQELSDAINELNGRTKLTDYSAEYQLSLFEDMLTSMAMNSAEVQKMIKARTKFINELETQ